LRRFIAAKDVTAILVDKSYAGPWRKLFGTLGVRPLDTGGVLFYRLRGTGRRRDLKRSSGRSMSL